MAKQRSWTDEQLRAAVASSTSYAMVLRALGLRPRGAVHWDVKARIDELGLDVRHFTSVQRRDAPSDVELRDVIARCGAFVEVLQAFGLPVSSAAHHRIRRRVRALGIDTTHFRRVRDSNRTTARRWTDDQLLAAVAASASVAGTLRNLGLVPAGGNYDHVQRRIRELGLDTSHFTGKAWNTGGKFVPRPAWSLEEVLVAGRWVDTHTLKVRLLREGIKAARCELCGWAQARPCDGVIPLELDHMNGDRNDNRLENLRILCPNCHALQPTHRGLNKKLRRTRP